jgi:hypothetical protein
MRPSVGASSPATSRSSVVLPLPLGPSSATMEEGSTSTSMPWTALKTPLLVLKCLTMPRTFGVGVWSVWV